MLHQVGAGTLGPVFRAHDPAEGRLVAIKAFRLDLVPEHVAEFAAALDALAGRNLEHPSIAAPIGAGVQGTTAWLAQAYIPAESLDSALRQYGPPPLGDALAIVTALAGALDYAAAAGVLHGALHPRDVLVAPDDTRLVDLGVAAALEAVGLRSPVRRPYTAPERIDGAPVSRAADVFALGAIAFELVTGQRVIGAGDQAVAALPDIPGANRESLADTFAFVLSASPDERFTTALGFAAALKRALAQASMLAVPPAPSAGPGLDAMAPARVADEPAPTSPPVPVEEPASHASPTVDTGAPAAPLEPAVRHRPRSRQKPPSQAPAARPEPHDEPVLAAPPLRETPHAESSSLDDLELRTGDAPGPVEREAERPREVVTPPPRVAPAVSQASFAVVSLPLVLVLLAAGALVGLGIGWLAFARGSEAPVQAGSAAPVTATASVSTVPAQAQAPARGESAGPAAPAREDPAEVSGPSAPSPAPAPRRVAAQAQAAPSPVRGRLTVRSNPAGARVEVNGRARGRTPLTVRDLPLGALDIRVVREGFGIEQRRVTLTASRAAQAIDVPLSRSAPVARTPATRPASGSGASEFVGSVFVETRPRGARVFIDGREVGRSPVEVPGVRAGSHVVRLELSGHKRWTASVSVVAGERNRVAASLEEEEVR